jgi:PTS system ascorbate-specific IIA component
MSVGIVVVTHGQIGRALIEVVEFILGQSLKDVRIVSISNPETGTLETERLHHTISSANSGEGVLALTDLPGASPSNLVNGSLEKTGAMMVTGLNLAMLLRVWNYRDQPLEALAKCAAEGGRRGIRVFDSQGPQAQDVKS